MEYRLFGGAGLPSAAELLGFPQATELEALPGRRACRCGTLVAAGGSLLRWLASARASVREGVGLVPLASPCVCVALLRCASSGVLGAMPPSLKPFCFGLRVSFRSHMLLSFLSSCLSSCVHSFAMSFKLLCFNCL
jgi:hypothetical protein